MQIESTLNQYPAFENPALLPLEPNATRKSQSHYMRLKMRYRQLFYWYEYTPILTTLCHSYEIFQPEGFHMCFGEMPALAKHKLLDDVLQKLSGFSWQPTN